MASQAVTVFGTENLVTFSVIHALSEHYDVRTVLTKNSASKLPASSTLTCIPSNVKAIHVNFDDLADVQKAVEGASAVVILIESDLSKEDGYDEEVSFSG